MPQIYHIGQFEHYHFAIVEFMPGITLRELLLSEMPFDMSALMHEVGATLANIAKHTFQQPGFFDNDLHIITHATDELLIFIRSCLESDNVLKQLTSSEISHIQKQFSQYQHILTGNEELSHLVHGDFDPANLLVDNINNTWKVTAVLDWEFAFSGSSLWDIANMLRYAHQMPSEFQNAFLKGFQDKGAILPEHWQITIHLLNLSTIESNTLPQSVCRHYSSNQAYFIRTSAQQKILLIVLLHRF